MRCLKCGFENSKDSTYCAQCGSSFKEMAQKLYAKEIEQEKENIPEFSIKDAGKCKSCGTAYNSQRHAPSYYLLRWLGTAALTFVLEYLIFVVCSLIVVSGDLSEISQLNILVYALVTAIPLSLIPNLRLYNLALNQLGITKVLCPECGNTGEKTYYENHFKRVPIKKNFAHALAEYIYYKTKKRNIFVASSVVLTMLSILTITLPVSLTVLEKPMDLNYLYLMPCSVPTIFLMVIGTVFLMFAVPLNAMSAVNVKGTAFELSCAGAGFNILSIFFMLKDYLIENFSRVNPWIDLTDVDFQVSWGGAKFLILLVNLFLIFSFYMSYKTEQVHWEQYIEKINQRRKNV